MVYLLTLVAALIVGSGEVVQQRWAAQAPQEDNLSPRLLLWLVRRPRWLGGVGLSLAGNLAFAGALSRGGVIVVEAVFVMRLVFVLVIAAVWERHPVPPREMFGGAAITAGLVGFLLAAHPTAGRPSNVPVQRWAVVGGSLLAVSVLLAVFASRTRASRRAVMLGAGAGTLYGLQASLTKSAVQVLTGAGVLALLMSWHAYAVVAVALLGMLLVQSAFEVAPIEASYPAVVTGQLLGSIAMGVGALGGSVRVGIANIAVMFPALLLMIVGIFLLAGSPTVGGRRGATRRADRFER